MSEENIQQPEMQTPPLTSLVTDPPAPTTENNPTETAPAEQEKKLEAAPEPLTLESLKMPEGFEVDETATGKFLEIMNDSKMAPGDRANALLSLQAEVAKSWSEKATAAFQDFQNQQQDEVRADPEVGGAKLDTTLSGISTLLNTYGSQEVREVFTTTGAGNNVHMVKFLSKIANALSEGKPVAGAPAAASIPLEQKLYPSMSKGN